jgi:hypothetical protein
MPRLLVSAVGAMLVTFASIELTDRRVFILVVADVDIAARSCPALGGMS